MSAHALAARYAVSLLGSIALLVALGVAASLRKLPGAPAADLVVALLPALFVVAAPCAAMWASLRTLSKDASWRSKLEVVLVGAGIATLVSLGAYIATPASNQRAVVLISATRQQPAPPRKSVRSQSITELADVARTIESMSHPGPRDLRLLVMTRYEMGKRLALPAAVLVLTLAALVLSWPGPGWGALGSAGIVLGSGAAWSALDDWSTGLALASPQLAAPLAFLPALGIFAAACILSRLRAWRLRGASD